jgi:exopolysaccharide biosynthesis protein
MAKLRKTRSGGAGSLLLKGLCVLLVTILVLVVFLYFVMLDLCWGHTEISRDAFVRSMDETSALKFLPRLYLSPEEIDTILHPPAVETPVYTQTDTSLVEINIPVQGSEAYVDPLGYVDEDGDGIILVPLRGGSYTGYMMIVLDPSRVIMGCIPESIGVRGYKVEEYVEAFDAVAGINAGGFDDPGGGGDGSRPDTMLVRDGQFYCEERGVGQGFVGIDDNYILHVGFSSVQDAKDWHIQEGCGFKPGPILVHNGEMAPEETLASGLNPRTAIGQRGVDGAILLLVIEGRQPSRLGATYLEEAEVMLRFGAVNAVNLDGGSSSMMWYNGEYINNSASIIGIRPLPSSFIVLKEGRADS